MGFDFDNQLPTTRRGVYWASRLHKPCHHTNRINSLDYSPFFLEVGCWYLLGVVSQYSLWKEWAPYHVELMQVLGDLLTFSDLIGLFSFCPFLLFLFRAEMSCWLLHSNARAGGKKSPWNECPPASGILAHHCHLPGQTIIELSFFCFQNILRSRESLPLKSNDNIRIWLTISTPTSHGS